jgi:hypothetical protein
MWCVFETGGWICCVITHCTVITVGIGFIRAALWEDILAGEWSAFVHLLIFQYHCFMIYWSHIKCMTTEPGVLPKDYDELDFNQMSQEIQETVVAVKT